MKLKAPESRPKLIPSIAGPGYKTSKADHDEKMRLFWLSLKDEWLTETEFYGTSDKEYLKPGRYYKFGNKSFSALDTGTHCVLCGYIHAHNYEWNNELELEEWHALEGMGTVLRAKKQSKIKEFIHA